MAAPSAAPKSSKHAKAGLTLSVARVTNSMREGLPGKNQSVKAAVYITGCMEHLLDSVLCKARDNAKRIAYPKAAKRLNLTDVIAGVRSDPDLARAYSGFTFGTLAPARKSVEFTLPSKEQSARLQKIKKTKLDRAAAKARRLAAANGEVVETIVD